MHIQTKTGDREAQCVILQLWCVSSDDFVLLKLKKEAAEEGAFLVRWSALNYHRIILAILNKNEVSQHSAPLVNDCGALMVKLCSTCVYSCVCVTLRMVRRQATSSFEFSTRLRCSVWRAGTKSSPVWKSSQTASRPLCSSLVRIALPSKNAVCRDKQVCVCWTRRFLICLMPKLSSVFWSFFVFVGNFGLHIGLSVFVCVM